MFLNIYHLIFVNGRRSPYESLVLWQIWKARNLLHFEGKLSTPVLVASKASEEAVAWFDVNYNTHEVEADRGRAVNTIAAWSPPLVGSVKCNVGVSWRGPESLCGASWIIRNAAGRVLVHSRRAFLGVISKLEAELKGFCWVAESLSSLHYSNVIIESICTLIRKVFLESANFPWFSNLINDFKLALPLLAPCSVEYVVSSRNRVAEEIAVSVPRDVRLQSYIATGGPCWLKNLLDQEAKGALH